MYIYSIDIWWYIPTCDSTLQLDLIRILGWNIMRPFIQTVGYHYCKLLSPARAMEWIYVDGLKAWIDGNG